MQTVFRTRGTDLPVHHVSAAPHFGVFPHERHARGMLGLERTRKVYLRSDVLASPSSGPCLVASARREHVSSGPFISLRSRSSGRPVGTTVAIGYATEEEGSGSPGVSDFVRTCQLEVVTRRADDFRRQISPHGGDAPRRYSRLEYTTLKTQRNVSW